MGFNDIQGGILAGNTLQAVGQAVAAGFNISDTAGHYATVVKMGRVLMLAPLVFILMYIFREKKNSDTKNINVPFPKFILWFIGFSALATFHILPQEIEHIISLTSHYIAMVAMAAIGLMIHFSTVIKTGGTAFKVSLLLFILQLILSSGLIILLID